ncbi:AAA family ATPase [Extibacter muris]|uniref:ATP-binding protein n=1 Tax=Extibacter muris TaxID=1796622 RepID=A0A4V2WSW1_9FIRM|nr:AAA family ATPase [Extibacter muris]MCU0079195.1 ATP-binding protein [Extibacter muris]TDA23270.1 ATP-binding protein [Extibacter muris]
MIINFTVSNFLSFNEAQTFSMSANKARKNAERLFHHSKLKLTKCNTIYGSNASGKSNLIQAFNFVKTIITEDWPLGFSQKYFRQASENQNIPSEFEIEFLCDGKHFKYFFSAILYKGSILQEKLSYYTKSGLEKLLFFRDTKNKKFVTGDFFSSKKGGERINTYGEDSLEDDEVLFLNLINKNKSNLYRQYKELGILRKIFKWFSNNVSISFPDGILTGYPYLSNSNINEITNLLNALGTGITTSNIAEVSLETVKSKIPEEMFVDIKTDLEKANVRAKKLEKYVNPAIIARAYKEFYTFEIDESDNIKITTIEFAHESGTFFSLKEESDGTVRLLDLIEILLNSSDDHVFIIDEMDRCLHPVLTTKIIELFLEKAQQKNTQLIITSHESRLLASEILRNDEITFVIKDSTGASLINPLERYQLRSDKKVYTALFDGTLDCIPQFNDEALKIH